MGRTRWDGWVDPVISASKRLTSLARRPGTQTIGRLDLHFKRVAVLHPLAQVLVAQSPQDRFKNNFGLHSLR